MLRSPRVVIARRELWSLRAEKTIVLALLIQLFIATFSSFLVVGLVSLYDPGSLGGTTVEAGVAGEASDDLVAAIEETDGIRAERYRTEARARTAFARGNVDAALLSKRDGGRIAVSVLAPDSNVRTTLVVVQVREALRVLERQERVDRDAYLRVAPLNPPARASASPYFGFTYTVLVPLLLFLPVFISGSITVDSITEEAERGTLDLLRVTPVDLGTILDGKLLASVGLAPAQAIVWLSLLELNGTHVANLTALVLLVTGLTLLVASLGAIVSILAPDRRVAQFLYSIGILVLFGGASMSSLNPANSVARLAVDSADFGVHLSVAAFLGLGIVLYSGSRTVADRVTMEN